GTTLLWTDLYGSLAKIWPIPEGQSTLMKATHTLVKAHTVGAPLRGSRSAGCRRASSLPTRLAQESCLNKAMRSFRGKMRWLAPVGWTFKTPRVCFLQEAHLSQCKIADLSLPFLRKAGVRD